MMATSRPATFAIVFTVACAAIYTACTELNLPLATYHPVIGQLDLGWVPERRGPTMYWYGWMLTASIGALVVAFLATFVPENWLQRGIAAAALAAVGYLACCSLALFIYDRAPIELEFLTWRWLSLAVAIVLAVVVACLLPARLNERLWPGWAWIVPLGAIAVLGYYLTPYFTR